MLDCHPLPLPHRSLLVTYVLARGCPSKHTTEMQAPNVKRNTLGLTDTIHVLLIVSKSAYLELPCIA